MKSFAVKEKRPASTFRTTHPYVHYPMGPAKRGQQETIRHILRPTGAQTKFMIGQPSNKYERKADQVAENVMRMPEPKQPWIQRQVVSREEEEQPLQAKLNQAREIEEQEMIQSKRVSSQAQSLTPDIEDGIKSLRSGGQALSESTRSYFEPRFGADFRQVRVHTDAIALSTAQALDARAFTTGRDMVFGPGQYSPETLAGKALLAHELTHVLQQTVRNVPRPKGGSDKSGYGRNRVITPNGEHSGRFMMDNKLKRHKSNQTVPTVQTKLFLSGKRSALRKVKKVMDKGLAPRYKANIIGRDVSISAIRVGGSQSRMNREFTKRLKKIVGDQTTTLVGVVEGGRPLLGLTKLGYIDINDIQALGIGGKGWDARAGLIHELVEIYEKQKNKSSHSVAHGKASAAEVAVIGAKIIHETGSTVKNRDGTLTGTRTTLFEYPDKSRWLVTVVIVKNDVIRVKRKRVKRGRPRCGTCPPRARRPVRRPVRRRGPRSPLRHD